jgi:ribosomal-protein-alanine N-acetyltransferase
MSVFDNFPVMDLGDIVLRELHEKDVKNYYQYLSDPMVNKFVSEDDIPKNIEEAKGELKYWQDLFTNNRSIYWAISKKNSGELIGTCGFNLWSRTHARVEISYDLSRKYWGKGIMTKALRAVCDFSFIRMNVKRIQASIAHDNIASIRVLEKLGFIQEGNLRSYGVLHKVTKDFYMYSLLSTDLVF